MSKYFIPLNCSGTIIRLGFRAPRRLGLSSGTQNLAVALTKSSVLYLRSTTPYLCSYMPLQRDILFSRSTKYHSLKVAPEPLEADLDCDEYVRFIAKLKVEKATLAWPDPNVQKHHILPLHAGGSIKGETVKCTIENHGQAHMIRYRVYGQKADKVAGLFILKQTAEGVKLRQELIVQTNKERGNVMFDPAWQKEQADKIKSSYYLQDNPEKAKEWSMQGGLASGKISKERAKFRKDYLANPQNYSLTEEEISKLNQESSNLVEKGRNLGKKYGRQGGIKSKQSPITKQMLNSVLIWKHKTGALVQTSGLTSVSDLVVLLNSYVPGSVNFASGLSSVLRGVEARRYGWEIIDRAISSQADSNQSDGSETST